MQQDGPEYEGHEAVEVAGDVDGQAEIDRSLSVADRDTIDSLGSGSSRTQAVGLDNLGVQGKQLPVSESNGQLEPARRETEPAGTDFSVPIAWNLLVGLLFAMLLIRWSLWPETPASEKLAAELNLAPCFAIDINLAGESEWQALPEIGPSIAKRIVAHRKQFGDFKSPEDLQAVPGFGPKTLESVRAMLLITPRPSGMLSADR